MDRPAPPPAPARPKVDYTPGDPPHPRRLPCRSPAARPRPTCAAAVSPTRVRPTCSTTPTSPTTTMRAAGPAWSPSRARSTARPSAASTAPSCSTTARARRRRARRCWARSPDGAVRLFPLGADGHLGIAEGIETALSAAGDLRRADLGGALRRWRGALAVAGRREARDHLRRRRRRRPAGGGAARRPAESRGHPERGSSRRSMATTSTTICSAAPRRRTTRRPRRRAANPRSRRWPQPPRDRALRPRCPSCPIWKPPPRR